MPTGARSTAATAAIREAMARDGLDAVIVSGNEYTGFEGAVTYMSGLRDRAPLRLRAAAARGRPVDRLPARGDATSASTGRRGSTSRCSSTGRASGSPTRCAGKRVGVYGLDYVMTVRDYRALDGAAEIVPWDVEFDHARAVKSELELESVRDSVRINTEGFWIFLEHFAPGQERARDPRALREVLRRAGLRPPDDGHGARRRRTAPRCRSSRSPATTAIKATDMVLPSLEVAGPGGHWVEVSRAICAGRAERRDAADDGGVRGVLRRCARARCKDGATAHDVHRAVSKGFLDRGFTLGHVTGHSIGMTMIEWPKIGEGDETELRENMVFSMHPHAISRRTGKACLYMQDTWLVTTDGGVPLADLPMKIFDGTESAAMNEARRSRSSPGEGGSDYERYLRTDALLALQKGADEWVHRDELLFQTVHQSSELWLKLAWNEVEEAARLVARRRHRGREPAAAPRERLPEARHGGARHARAHVAVGVHRGAQGARPRQRLRLARLPRDPPRREAARRGVPRRARARRPDARRGLHARPRVRGALPRSPSS